MTNPGSSRNYARGRAREYRELDKMRKEGYDIVFRSAGSHSAIDCIGIRLKDKHIKLVQCKPRSMCKNAKVKITHTWELLNDEFLVSFECV